MATLELVYTGAVGGDAVCPPEEVYTLVLQEYGPLEARLQRIDRVVLGGLNEGTWPGRTRRGCPT